MRTANRIPPARRASMDSVCRENRVSRSELGVSGKYGVELSTSGRDDGGAFWVDSANRENSIHVFIIRLREMVVIQSEVKIRWNHVLTWDTAPFPIPVPFGNLGDGVGGG